MRKIKKFLKKNPGLIFIIFLFIAVFLLISPVFEFPLNDSWAYAKSVKNFADSHEVRISEWAAASFVFQLFYGYLFTIPFGFSFTALRISTIVLSFFGIIAFYFILKEFKFPETISTLGALLLFFNPIYFNLSYTFMTDIPLVSLLLISTLFYIKGIKQDRFLYLAFGSLSSIFAVLVRQNAILLPLTILVYLFIIRKLNFKKVLLTISPFVALILFQVWYAVFHGAGERYHTISFSLRGMVNPFRMGLFLLISVFCMGLYFFLFTPLFIANIKRLKKLREKRFFTGISVIIFGILVVGFILYYILRNNFPFLGYQGFIINNYGLGPKLLAGISPIIPPIVWAIISIFAVIASLIFTSIIIYEIFYKKNFYLKKLRLRKESLNILIILILLFQLAFILVKTSMFDRYLLTITPFFIILLFEIFREFKFNYVVKYLYIVIISLAIFSLIGTSDYINYNKASWYGSTLLLKQGTSPKEIDGGFEFNGWYNYEYALENLNISKEEQKNKFVEFLGIKIFAHPTKEDAISWWFVVDDKYIISFSELDNYKTIKKIEYKSYLFPGEQYVYILRRI